MKKTITVATFALALTFTINAYAGMWMLVRSEILPTSGYMCTYRLGNYETTISNGYNMCPSFIDR